MIHPRSISVINGKGGVLKTTLAVNQAAFLALTGRVRVLVIDFDPQGNAEDDLGYADNPLNDHGESVAKGLMFGDAVTALADVRPNLDVWTGGEALSAAATSIGQRIGANKPTAKLALATLIEKVANDYDYIFIDCPPGEGPLQQLALAASRWAQIPTKTDESSIKGLRKVAERFDEVLDVNGELELLGVVITGVGAAATLKDGTVIQKQSERSARQRIAEELGTNEGVIYDRSVRHSETVAVQARRHGLVTFELEDRAKIDNRERIAALKRGEKVSSPAVSKTSHSVADDMQTITQETVARIMAAEATDVTERGIA